MKQLKDLGFSLQICVLRGGIATFTAAIDPTDAVKPFLKHIARAWNYIVVTPAPQAFRAA